MIDLSYLTEEEQEMIMAVLKRDSELKKSEEDRLKHLQKVVPKEDRRKYMTGEWFYEIKSQRHQDRIHGSDIIIASMKQQKPTLDDCLTRSWGERTRSFNIKNNDGVSDQSQERVNSGISETQQERLNRGVRSPSKPRHNPFNRIPVELDFEETDSQFTKDASGSGLRRSSANSDFDSQVKHQESTHAEYNTDIPRQKPVPKKRTKIFKPQSSLSDSASSLSTQSVSSQSVSTQSISTQSVSTTEGSGVRTPAPRGILKYSSSCSSSEFTVKNQLPEPVATLSYTRKNSDQENDFEEHKHSLKSKEEPGSKAQNEEPPKYPSSLKLPKSRLPVRVPSQLINPPQGTQEKAKIQTRSSLSSIPTAGKDKKAEDSLKQKRTDDSLPHSPHAETEDQKKSDEALETFSFSHENAKSALTTDSVKPLDKITSHPTQQRSETMENHTTMFPKLETTRAEENLAVDHQFPSAFNIADTANKANASTDIESSPSAFNIRKMNNQESKHSPTDEQGNSITKVLEWFSRSTDSSDMLDVESNEDIEEDPNIDDIDFEDEANLKAKTMDNVYLIIPRQSEVKSSEVNSIFLQETDWGKEISIDEPPQNKPKQRKRSESTSHKESLIMKPSVDMSNILTQSEDIVSRQIEENDSFTNRETKEEPKVKLETDFKVSRKVEENYSFTDRETKEESKVKLETDFKVHQQKERTGVEENQRPKLANLRSFWERENIGPKILISKSNAPAKNELLIPSNVGKKLTDGVNDQIITEQNLGIRSPEHQRMETTSVVDDLDLTCVGSGNTIHKPQVTTVTGESKDLPFTYSNQKKDQICVSSSSDKEATTLLCLKSLSLDSGTVSVKSSDGDCTLPKDSEPKCRTTPKPNPAFVKQKSQQQENMTEKIKQLKSFWEKEKSERRTSAQNSKSSMASTGKLNKRFTKSEFDLTSVGVEFDDDDTSERGKSPNFSVYPLRKEKPAVTDGISTLQFKNLRDFWGGSPIKKSGPNSPVSKSENQSPFGLPTKHSQIADISKETAFDSPKDPSLKMFNAHSERSNVKTLVNESQTNTKQSLLSSPAKTELAPSSSSKKKTTTRHEPGSKIHHSHVDEAISHGVSHTNQTSVKDTTPPKPAAGQESRPHQSKSSSKSSLTGKTKAMRRASSMFSVNTAVEEQSQIFHPQIEESQSPSLHQVKKATDSILTPSRKTQQPSYTLPKTSPENSLLGKERNSQKKTSHTSEDSDFQPLARSFIPPDYQHYLGITEKKHMYTPPPVTEMDDFLCTSFSTSPETSRRCKCSPVRTSTPVSGSPDLQTRRGSLRLLSTTHIDGHDCDDDSKTSTAGNLSRDNESSVQKALRRAASRPVYHKSMDNISTSGQGQNIKQMDDSEQVPSTHVQTSFATSDLEHLKQLSKSVPSFLQKKSDEGESDSESSSRSGIPHRQYTNLSSYSGYSGSASLSSVSGSVVSVYSGDYGSVEVQGTIQFSLNYVQKLREFHIFVVQCQNLAAVDVKRNRSDPYVKSYLIPDTANLGKRKTAVKKKTLNPTYNEILRYRVRMEYLKSQVLNLSVWHNDTFGRNSFLGEAELDLSLWDFNDTERKFLPLKPRSPISLQPLDLRGQMRLAIRFLPQISKSKSIPGTGEVHIWVKDCKNLPLTRSPSIDPYVKCFVLPDTSKKSRQKTRVLKKTTSPVFNHTMVYDGFRAEDLKEACVELTVWDRDRRANHLLGGLRLGMGTGKSYGVPVNWMDSTAEEVDLWRRMMESPSEWVEDMLPLRMLTTDNNTWK